tara:strand:- start:4346 stop:4726 length:381 start_codon:yes stop_codon:yes gene_type:complete
MAFSNDAKPTTFVASTDMRSHQNGIVDLTTTDHKIDMAAAGGAIGILINNPNAGEHAAVAIEGIALVRVGLAVTAGDIITSAATGWGTDVTSGAAQWVVGRALTAAASGMLTEVDINIHRVNTGAG